MERGDADVGYGGVSVLEERITLVGHGVDVLGQGRVRVGSGCRVGIGSGCGVRGVIGAHGCGTWGARGYTQGGLGGHAHVRGGVP